MARNIPTSVAGAMPATYTRIGRVTIEPPPPRAPNGTPIKNASSSAISAPLITFGYPPSPGDVVYERTCGKFSSAGLVGGHANWPCSYTHRWRRRCSLRRKLFVGASHSCGSLASYEESFGFLFFSVLWAQSPLEFLNHGKPILDAHDCYPGES